MAIYWLMYLFAAIGSLMHRSILPKSGRGTWLFVWLFYVILIGFRESGGDWYNYSVRFEQLGDMTLSEALQVKDIGYQFVGYYINHWDLGFFTLTVLCAAISMAGLIFFLREQLNPWLGLTVAVPYLIIVVYMGYMRQGVALGLVMWGLVYLQKGRFVPFLLLVALATTFHKSAIMMIAFGIFSGEHGRILKLIAVTAAIAGIWAAFVGSGAEHLWHNYVETKMQSQGAQMRVLLNAVPAMLLFYFRKRWRRVFPDFKLWAMISLATFVLVPLTGFASTAVDRMALYFLPLQIVVFSRLPYLAREIVAPRMTLYAIVAFYAIVLFIWLNYAHYAKFWLPYVNLLWEGW